MHKTSGWRELLQTWHTCALQLRWHRAGFWIRQTSRSVHLTLFIWTEIICALHVPSLQHDLWPCLEWQWSQQIRIKKENSRSPVVIQHLKNWSFLNICANIVNQQQRSRPRTIRRKRHRLALASASHSPKHFSMAFLLFQLPTLTVGMILSGWSHWTNRFNSKKLLCSLYGMPVKTAGREDWVTPQCFSSYRGDVSSHFKPNHRNLSGNIFHSETYHFEISHSPC